MKLLAALALAPALACSSAPGRDAPVAPGDDAPAVPAPAGDRARDVGAVVVAADFIHGKYDRERTRLDAAALDAAARGCLDQHVPVTSRPDAGQWVIGVTFSPSSARVTPDVVASRSLVDSEPVPEALATCVAEAAPPADLELGRVEALIAIRTRGWLAAHDAATPLDDPARAWVISIWRRAVRADGSTQDLDDDDVRRVAEACADEAVPVRARTEPVGWGVLHVWRNPDGEGGGFAGRGFGGVPDSANLQDLPYSATPAGFEACVERGLPAPSDVDGTVVSIKTNIQVATLAWIDEHNYGVLRRGAGVP